MTCRTDAAGHCRHLDICKISALFFGECVFSCAFFFKSAYKARNAVRTAVIPLGYSHGFGVEKIRDSYRLRDGIRYIAQDLKRTIFGQKVYVRINGKPVRVLGHIGMLHTVIDVTKVDCEIGDTVVANVNPLYVNGSIMRKFTQL